MTGGKAAAVLMDARRHANPAAPPEPLQLLGFMHAEGTPW
jgi:hypothetical protein